MSGLKTLVQVKAKLKTRLKKAPKSKYFVPSVWMDPDFEKPVTARQVNPAQFFLDAIEKILSQPPVASVTAKGEGGDWSRHAIIYNLFVRLGTAFDHNQNGRVDIASKSADFRETGTFMKSIALLPYIKALGADTIHLLPITLPGADGKKGNLGSPYAIRDPYRLDESLSEPFLGLGAEVEFKAFVEAAHHLGMAVVLEFVFRTAAKDSDWAKRRPEWFYWIKNRIADRPIGSRDENFYGAPILSPDTLAVVKRYEFESFQNPLPPPALHRDMFVSPPKAETVKKEKGRWVGKLADGTRVRVPGAFADWPPDDPQPPWGDVTYLKMYDHPYFNYIAYNTVRMYDPALAQSQNAQTALWREIEGILPHYQEDFGIDGVMIDMGHALPHDLFKNMVRRAREINPNFAFWEESFTISKQSRENGYNISMGYLFCDIAVPAKLAEFIQRCAGEGMPIPFLGTAETHDTPRTAARGGRDFSRFSFTLSCLLPGVPYIHGGFELEETVPVNTGLFFTPEEIAQLPPENLPLFSASSLNWLGEKPLLKMVRDMAAFRSAHAGILCDSRPESFKISSEGDEIDLVKGENGAAVRAVINPQTREIKLR